MINNMDLIREKLAYHHTATDDEIIKTVLKNAREDPEYLAACEGLRYYRGMQDILQKDFRETVVYEEDENSPAGIKRGGVKIINENGGKMPDAVGIPEEQLRKAATMAVCKINIDSDLRLAFTASVRKHFNEHPDHFDPRQYLTDARSAIKGLVEHKIVDVLGCNGKA